MAAKRALGLLVVVGVGAALAGCFPDPPEKGTDADADTAAVDTAAAGDDVAPDTARADGAADDGEDTAIDARDAADAAETDVGCETPAECPAPGPCQEATCADGVCGAKAAAGTCDDGDPCTLVDTCQDGVCVGSGVPDDTAGDWLQSFDGDGDDAVVGVTFGADDAVTVVLETSSTSLAFGTDPDGSPVAVERPASAAHYLVSLRMTAYGAPLTATVLASADALGAVAVTGHDGGRFTVAGAWTGTLGLGDDTASATTPAVFLARFAASGQLVWRADVPAVEDDATDLAFLPVALTGTPDGGVWLAVSKVGGFSLVGATSNAAIPDLNVTEAQGHVFQAGIFRVSPTGTVTGTVRLGGRREVGRFGAADALVLSLATNGSELALSGVGSGDLVLEGSARQRATTTWQDEPDVESHALVVGRIGEDNEPRWVATTDATSPDAPSIYLPNALTGTEATTALNAASPATLTFDGGAEALLGAGASSAPLTEVAAIDGGGDARSVGYLQGPDIRALLVSPGADGSWVVVGVARHLVTSGEEVAASSLGAESDLLFAARFDRDGTRRLVHLGGEGSSLASKVPSDRPYAAVDARGRVAIGGALRGSRTIHGRYATADGPTRAAFVTVINSRGGLFCR
ncbi:MAG: hypothetical protein H6745_15755 [Deltaproteobacteria bacterium]|nr:hypothetical protein [Deltaproteobacteria bacterium]